MGVLYGFRQSSQTANAEGPSSDISRSNVDPQEPKSNQNDKQISVAVVPRPHESPMKRTKQPSGSQLKAVNRSSSLANIVKEGHKEINTSRPDCQYADHRCCPCTSRSDCGDSISHFNSSDWETYTGLDGFGDMSKSGNNTKAWRRSGSVLTWMAEETLVTCDKTCQLVAETWTLIHLEFGGQVRYKKPGYHSNQRLQYDKWRFDFQPYTFGDFESSHWQLETLACLWLSKRLTGRIVL